MRRSTQPIVTFGRDFGGVSSQMIAAVRRPAMARGFAGYGERATDPNAIEAAIERGND
jgi:hypothetical protein